jgi:hypothetical protein
MLGRDARARRRPGLRAPALQPLRAVARARRAVAAERGRAGRGGRRVFVRGGLGREPAGACASVVITLSDHASPLLRCPRQALTTRITPSTVILYPLIASLPRQVRLELALRSRPPPTPPTPCATETNEWDRQAPGQTDRRADRQTDRPTERRWRQCKITPRAFEFIEICTQKLASTEMQA